MSTPIPGLNRIQRPEAAPRRQSFIGEMLSANSVCIAGAAVEVFTTAESPSAIAAGDRVRVLFSVDTQQCFVVEVIS